MTETDLVELGFVDARQPDTDRLRTWEVAGAAHLDASAMAAADAAVEAGHLLPVDAEPMIADAEERTFPTA